MSLAGRGLVIPKVAHLSFLFAYVQVAATIRRLRGTVAVQGYADFRVALRSYPILELMIYDRSAEQRVVRALCVVLRYFHASLNGTNIVNVAALEEDVTLGTSEDSTNVDVVTRNICHNASLDGFCQVAAMVLMGFHTIR